MDIFESLENLNVSEECFDEIIESITKIVAPILAGKDKHGREESIGTKIDRASHKHPYIMKASSAVDNAINKVRNIGQQKDNRTPEEKLKNVKPAGTIYGKDMYSNAQLKDASYKMFESLYNEIANLVEELILERNKVNREAKKNWELQNRGGYHTDYLYDRDENKESNKYYQHSKKHEVGSNQDAIHSLKKYIGDENPATKSHAIDQLARSSRVILGREQDPVSYTHASEYSKNRSGENRKEQSQRGSTKDSYTRVGSPEERKEPGEILKKQEEKRNK